MEKELELLTAAAMLFPSGKVNKYKYGLMDALGLKPTKKADPEHRKVCQEYFRRRFHLRGRAFRDTYKLLGKKFKVEQMKEEMGYE